MELSYASLHFSAKSQLVPASCCDSIACSRKARTRRAQQAAAWSCEVSLCARYASHYSCVAASWSAPLACLPCLLRVWGPTERAFASNETAWVCKVDAHTKAGEHRPSTLLQFYFLHRSLDIAESRCARYSRENGDRNFRWSSVVGLRAAADDVSDAEKEAAK